MNSRHAYVSPPRRLPVFFWSRTVVKNVPHDLDGEGIMMIHGGVKTRIVSPMKDSGSSMLVLTINHRLSIY